MRKKSAASSFTFHLLLINLALLILFVKLSSVEARNKRHGHKMKNAHPPAPAPHPAPYPTTPSSTVFNVMSFGAAGDGVSPDSKALLAAWEAACEVPGATVEFPAEFKFLIEPLTLQGPCAPGLILQIDGTVLAPPKVWSGPKSVMYQWINFKWLHNFTIQGSGAVDGRGSHWWAAATSLNFGRFYLMKKKQETSKPRRGIIPTALRFYASFNVTVADITIINSPNCHLKFDNCGGIKVHHLAISAPESSTNTDGIHLQNSQDVEIHHSTIGCGDDCVSIQTGCINIHIHHINCGPGHGISLGGLGKGRTVACVSNIVVENVTMTNTLYGARIKTWQGGLGAVKNVSFSNIQVSNVNVPVVIDQYYCDKHSCKNQTGAVAISGVKFDQINGTYSIQPLHLACSTTAPCSDVKLSAIDLQPSPEFRGGQHPEAACWNSYGTSHGPLVPSSIDYCVRKETGWLQRIARSQYEKHC